MTSEYNDWLQARLRFFAGRKGMTHEFIILYVVFEKYYIFLCRYDSYSKLTIILINSHKQQN